MFKGRNELHLNQATMCALVQKYINENIQQAGITVCGVNSDKINQCEIFIVKIETADAS